MGTGTIIILSIAVVLIIGMVLAYLDERTQKEIAIEAIKAGLVQAPVVKIVLDTYEQEKQITELAWVKNEV